jgi:signal transduction histidine kinase
LLPVHGAQVFLYQDEHLTFGAGIQNRIAQMVDVSITADPSPLTYQVARTGEVVLVEDVQNDPRLIGMPPEWFTGFRALLDMPLNIGDRVVGVMKLTFDTSEDLFNLDMSFIQLLISQASIAIENARLYKTVQDHITLLESRVEQRTAELERERAQLQVIMDSMGEGLVYNERQQIRYQNEMFNQMTGIRMEAGSSFLSLLELVLASQGIAEQVFKDMNEQLERVGIWRGETRLCHTNGKEFDASIICTVVRGAGQEPQGVVTLIRDISQEKALQFQKDLFITRASHELRTPLTNLKTRLYLIGMRPEKTGEHLRIIENVTEHMINLVEDLLDLSRVERGRLILQRNPHVLQELVTNVVETQHAEAERKEIKLVTELPSEDLILSMDSKRMHQVLTNLIVNGITYTDEGGQIIVRAHAEEDRAILEIEDTGVGIAPEMTPQVFEPFFRVREGSVPGTGLGLSISKEIVEAHGGTLSVRSQLGSGSTFSIMLPR